MNRNEKIRKLNNAVKDWRGSYHAKTKKWIKAPQPAAVQRVCRWLEELGIDAAKGVDFIGQMTSEQQLNDWLKAL